MGNLKKNLAFSSIYQILIILLPLVTAPYISRVIGPSGLGTYSYSFSIANYFVLFAMLGVNNYGSRSIAMVKDNKKNTSEIFWGIYYLQLILALMMSSFYFIFMHFFLDETNLIFILQFIYVISAAFDVNWLCFGLEKFKITITRNITIKLLSVISIFLFVKTKDDLWIYTLIMVGGVLLSQVLIWPFVYKSVDFVLPNFASIKKHIKPNLILFIPVISISIYKITDKILLGLMSDINEVGYFVTMENIMNIPLGLITALGVVMLPRMSSLVAKGETKKGKDLIEKSMFFVMFISFALAFGLAGIAPVFVPWFLGSSFTESTQLLIYIAPTIVFISWANVVRTQYLIPNSKNKIYIISVISGAIVNLTINIVLIPFLGALGAIIGITIAEAFVCIIQTYMIRKELNYKDYIANSYIFIFIGMVMFLIIRAISTFSYNSSVIIIAQVLVGAIVYVALSILYLIIIKKNNKLINVLLTNFYIRK